MKTKSPTPPLEVMIYIIFAAAIAFLAITMAMGCAQVRGQPWSGSSDRPRGLPRCQTPRPAVVRIATRDRDGTNSLGSGTLIGLAQGHALVLTNDHVIRNAAAVDVIFPNGFRAPGRVVRSDAQWDLAAIAIGVPAGQVLPRAVPIAAGPPQIGEPLTLAGHGPGCYREATGRVTQFLSPERSGAPYDIVEIGSPARQGDSGGPMLNSRGQLAATLFGTDRGTTSGTHAGRIRVFLTGLWSDATPPSSSSTIATAGEQDLPDAAGDAPSRLVPVVPPKADQAAAPPKPPITDLPEDGNSAKPAAPTPAEKGVGTGLAPGGNPPADKKGNNSAPFLKVLDGGLTTYATAALVGLGVPGIAAGVAVWLTRRILVKRFRQKLAKPTETAPSATFPEPPLDDRSEEFGKQLVRLFAAEGRNPLHDATRGRIYDTEADELALRYKDNPLALGLVAELKRQVDLRFNEIHPVAVDFTPAT